MFIIKMFVRSEWSHGRGRQISQYFYGCILD